MKKKHKLDIQQPQSFYFAVSCHEPLHKLAWIINTNLSLSLQEYKSLETPETYPSQRDDISFPEQHLILIKNKGEASNLFRELPNIDYVLMIEGNASEGDIKQLISGIKKLQSIIAIIAIDPKKVKNIQIINAL